MNRWVYLFLLLFCFRCNPAEMSTALDVKSRLLAGKKSHFTLTDWNTSRSCQIIALPQDIGLIIEH